MLPISNMTSKIFSRAQANPKYQWNGHPSQWTQANRAHGLTLTVRVEQPVRDMEMGITVLLLWVPLVVINLSFNGLVIVVGGIPFGI